MKFPRIVLSLMAAGLLGSCATDPNDIIACPALEVLHDLEELTRFNPGPGRDPTDVQVQAWINRVNGDCSLDDGELLVDLLVELATRQGPANKSPQAEIRYFVAITDTERNILNRRSFVASAPFTSRKTISFQDSLTLSIPVAQGVEGDAFTVYVGLELTPAELEFNRRTAKR